MIILMISKACSICFVHCPAPRQSAKNRDRLSIVNSIDLKQVKKNSKSAIAVSYTIQNSSSNEKTTATFHHPNWPVAWSPNPPNWH